MGTKSKAEGLDILRKRGYDSFTRLDSGGQGNVYKTAKNKITYAAKVVHVDDIDKGLDDDLKRELAIIKNVKHPNIIRVQDLFRTKHKVFIVMDFMPNKSIGDEIDTNGLICEWKAKVYFTQICSAIRYLHKHNVAHRDLKLDNILLDAHFNPKVCDFGFSKFVQKDPKTGKLRKSESFVGTPSYEPPEVLMNTPYDAYKCDVWCLGICLFVMINYEYPFNSDEPRKTIFENQTKRKYRFQSKVEAKLSNDAKDLVRKLLEPNPKLRISIDDTCKHNWLPIIVHQIDIK